MGVALGSSHVGVALGSSHVGVAGSYLMGMALQRSHIWGVALGRSHYWGVALRLVGVALGKKTSIDWLILQRHLLGLLRSRRSERSRSLMM